MSDIELLYGKGIQSASVPEHALTIMPRDLPALESFEQALESALDNPIGSLPLGEIARRTQGKVAIIVNDPTRLANSHLFLPQLLNYLNRNQVTDDRMYIVFALGSHRPMTDDEITETVGQEVRSRVACYNHDAENKQNLVFCGVTSRGTAVWLNARVAAAELRILTGSVVHHFFAGFGGGRKALVPGVAGRETIQKNHSMMMLPNADIGRLEDNPVNHDLTEAAKLCGGGFLLNVVLNEKKQFVGVFCGDMVEAHAKACEMVRHMNTVKLPWTADVVIASCGGYPKDINMYQAQKTLENAAQAVRRGGYIVLLAECADGVGSDMYLSWARKYKTLPRLEEALRNEFVLGGHKAYAVARLLDRASVHLVSCLEPELQRELGFIPAESLAKACETVLAAAGGEAKVLIMPQGSITVPER